MGSSPLRERGFGRVPALFPHAENDKADCHVRSTVIWHSTHCTQLHTDHLPAILNG
jgi:hypothetical protein